MVIHVWQIWLVLAIVFGALELMGMQFIMLALAVSALVVMVATLLFAPGFAAQMTLFAVTALILTPAFIFWFKRHFQGRQAATGVVGESGYGQREVTVRQRGEGVAVQLDGNWFPAQFENGKKPADGDNVRIIRFQGITAIVAAEGDHQ